MARLAAVGLRTRKLRASLSALGIAIGVAAITAVLGLSASSQAGLLAEIARLGTNLLTIQNGQTLTGGTAELPVTAPAMIGRLPGVTQVEDAGTVNNVNAFRSPLIPSGDTNALTVDATSLGLPATVGTSVSRGSYLNRATAHQPVAVLGAAAAQRLGIDKIFTGERIWVGGMWFYLTGILRPAALAPRLIRRCWSATPQRRNTCASTATPRPSTCGLPPLPSPASTTCSLPRPTRKTLVKSTSPSPPPRSPPRSRPKARSTPCSWAWALSPCWSAPSE
jgi:putative ABC transport system permease protein